MFDSSKFKAFFKQRKLKAVRVAETLGISESNISRYKSGKLPLDEDFLRKFCNEYKCDISDFETSENEKATPSESGDALATALKTIDRLTQERNDLSTRLDSLQRIEEAQTVKIVALETFLLQLATEVRKTSLKDQSVAFGKIEGAEIRRLQNKNNPASDDKKSRKKEFVER